MADLAVLKLDRFQPGFQTPLCNTENPLRVFRKDYRTPQSNQVGAIKKMPRRTETAQTGWLLQNNVLSNHPGASRHPSCPGLLLNGNLLARFQRASE